MNFLNAVLPQNITSEFYSGNFKKVEEISEYFLKQDNTPDSLKTKIKYLNNNIKKIRKRYIYNKEEILNLFKENFKDFSEEELEKYKISEVVDYLFINGEEKYLDNTISSIVKTIPEIKKRQKIKSKDSENEFLNNYIDKFMNKKNAKLKIRMKTSITRINLTDESYSKIKVWIPIPSVNFQVKSLNIIDNSENLREISNPSNISGTAYFEGNKSSNEFFVEYEYTLDQRFNTIEINKSSYIYDFNYTSEYKPHIIFSELIKDVNNKITKETDSPILKARKIYDYITKNIRYSYMRPYSTYERIPDYVIANQRGDCGMQVLLFITLCRYNCIPAKWQSGLYLTEKSGLSHDWAQFYIEPYGWLFADLSFGGGRKTDKKLHDFYFGNIDPLRMPANNRFQYSLYPEKKFFRNDPYDNQVGEIETDKEGIFSEDFTTKHDVIDITEIG